jgi:flagellar biosynthesis GTPase FlhF
MKLKSLLLLALAALLALAVPRTARAQDVSFDFFYDALSPYGEWVEVGGYGLCWRPNDVDEDWAPYSDGYWSYTDAGWTWVSYEDYGGIVYHYGRWSKVEDEGWVWVPDYEWGPAWVSWRRSDDYVGWAPLPVEARWQQDRGFSTWVDSSYDIAPTYYNFCHNRDFGAPVLRPLIVRRSENIVIINNSVNITNVTYNQHAGVIFNGGPDYVYMNRFAQRPIPALKLVRNTNVTVVNNTIVNNNVRVTNFNAVQRGNQLTVLAPRVSRPQQAQLATFVKPGVTKVIPQQKVTKGWGSIPTEQRNAIRAQRLQEMKGLTPETAPAKPVKTADLQVVPVKANPNAKIPQPPRRGPNAGPVTQPGNEQPDVQPITKVPPTQRPGVVTPDARENIVGKPSKPGRPGRATPAPVDPAQTADNPPTGVPNTPPAISPDRVKPGRPGVVKPFMPNGDNNPTDGTAQNPRPSVVPPNNAAAIEKRNAAVAEAAARKQAAQDAIRQRAADQSRQQDMTRQNNAEAAAAKQQQLQQQAAARKQAVDQQQDQREALRAKQMQAQQNQQEALRARTEQAAENRQKVLQAQQDAARQRPQAPEVQRPQVQSRPQIQPQQRDLQPQQRPQVQPRPQNVPQGQRQVPGRPGKPVNPDDAANQKN